MDGIVCNFEAAVLIHSFKTEKDEMMPTHSIVKLTVSTNTMKQKKEFHKKLVIVEKTSEATIEDDLGQKGEGQQGTGDWERKAQICEGGKGKS